MNAAQYILVFGVRLYRWAISPAKAALFGPLARCRFTPSCSEYAMESIRAHGAVAGVWLALRRLGRCHPWGDCGWDPVPAAPPGTFRRRRIGVTVARQSAVVPLETDAGVPHLCDSRLVIPRDCGPKPVLRTAVPGDAGHAPGAEDCLETP